MISNSSSVEWETVASALGNHLWQSTLFAIVVGLLILMLRKNQARVRYWLWLTASVKFLIPFSLLISAGSYLAKPYRPVEVQPTLYLAMDEVSQPFMASANSVPTRDISVHRPDSVPLIPGMLLVAWLCGFIVVLAAWSVRWRRISAALRKAVPLSEGREWETLHRLQDRPGIRSHTKLMLVPASLEPGIFGIVRPKLMWPDGITKHLDDAHLEAILLHEMCHVRRYDNLTAAMHMAVGLARFLPAMSGAVP